MGVTGRFGFAIGCALAACAVKSGTGAQAPVTSEPSPTPSSATANMPPSATPAPAPGSELRVGVVGDAVLVDEQSIAKTSPGEVKRIDPLFTELKRRAEDAGRAHAVYSLAVADGVDGAVFKSAFQTAAFAGWPEARFGAEGAVLLKARIPGPPGSPLARQELAWPTETLVIIVRSDAVEVSRAPADPPASSKAIPQSIGRVEISKIDADLGALLARECSTAKPCSPAVLYAADTADSSSVARALEALRRAAAGSRERPVEVQFRINDPAAPGTPVAIRAGMVTKVSGRLPPEHIQKVARANFKFFRQCYEAGLGRDATLTGRVAARFVIGRDGAVSNVSDAGSDLPDQAVVECVLKAFYQLRFDKPDGGIVTVIYPIQLAPG